MKRDSLIYSLVIIIAGLLFYMYMSSRKYNVDIQDYNKDINSLIEKFDSIYESDTLFKSKMMLKIDSISMVKSNIINNYGIKKNAIIDGTISDDSVSLFIANEIHNRREGLLLLHSR